ncbi:MAG: hypothetical protein DI551_09795 [Micavibrio aeruginosavorus]|uniref:Uncharacterized protein n=1 Tax=Micavibrio aeruginosavorus TaxID=349221 RepID=A0A2W5PQ23_9BACT|nr:MAG: hypothetical protein DI551_09795 [Micavibrio aeruginosavorus]
MTTENPEVPNLEDEEPIVPVPTATMPHYGDQSAVARGAMWSILNQSAAQILALVVFLITARFVSKEDFGIMAVCMLVVEGFKQVALESVGISISARKDPTDKEYNACFMIILVGSIVCASIAYLSVDLIADMLGNPAIAPALHWVCLLILTIGLTRTHEAWFEKHLQFKKMTIRSLLSIGIGGAVGIYMAIHGFGIASLIAQQLVTALVALVFLWLATTWRPSLNIEMKDVKDILKYSKFVSMNAGIAYLNGQSDVFFSTYYLGAANTGLYNSGKRIVTAAHMMLVNGISRVALPAMAASSDENRANNYLKWNRLTTLFLAPVYVGIALLAEDTISILLGDKWIEAAPILSVLILASYFTQIDKYNSNLLLVLYKPHWQSVFTTTGAILNIVILYLFTRHGVVWLAFGYLVKTSVMYPLSVYISTRLLNISFWSVWKELAPSLISSGIMAAALLAGREYFESFNPFISIAIQAPLGALIYFGSMWVIARKSIEEVIAGAKLVLPNKKAA